MSAIFGYLNVRLLKLPDTIGLMIIALLFTFGILIAGKINPKITELAQTLIHSIDFKTVLLDIMLSFLLFAGAMHTNFEQLKVQRLPIIIFATLGVLMSTLLIGTISFYLLNTMGFSVIYLHCLLFGALISPTDPIAVLGILKKAGVPKKLETKIVGESLFNDGIGVVIFIALYQIATSASGHVDGGEIGLLLLEEVGGGLLLGLVLGYIAYRLMRSIDDYDIEVMITLAIVMGGYLLASKLHFSGPLAMVVAGLIVGNDTIRQSTMSEITERYVDKFWELIDILLNAILFVLIGLELLVIASNSSYILAGVILIPLLLLSRFIALGIPIQLLKKKLDFIPHTGLIMTWGGLRGGISIALALSLTTEMNRELFLTITYIIVVFSIIVQGLTVGKLVKKLNPDLVVPTDEQLHH